MSLDNTIQLNEKTLQRINKLQEQINISQTMIQNILATVLEANDAEGEYSFDGKNLIKKEE